MSEKRSFDVVTKRKELARLEKQIATTDANFKRLWDTTYPPERSAPIEWSCELEINARELEKLRKTMETLQLTRDELAGLLAKHDIGIRAKFANMGITVPQSSASATAAASTSTKTGAQK